MVVTVLDSSVLLILLLDKLGKDAVESVLEKSVNPYSCCVDSF